MIYYEKIIFLYANYPEILYPKVIYENYFDCTDATSMTSLTKINNIGYVESARKKKENAPY